MENGYHWGFSFRKRYARWKKKKKNSWKHYLEGVQSLYLCIFSMLLVLERWLLWSASPRLFYHSASLDLNHGKDWQEIKEWKKKEARVFINPFPSMPSHNALAGAELLHHLSSAIGAHVPRRFSYVWLFVGPLPASLWTVVHEAALPVRFSRQDYWSGLPCPLPGLLWVGGSFTFTTVFTSFW